MVSENARRLREEKRLTLDEAARLTGVSRSMLAQIEKGDAVIFMNFRPDRAREITRTLVDPDFTGFERKNGYFLAGGAGPGAAGAAAGR